MCSWDHSFLCEQEGPFPQGLTSMQSRLLSQTLGWPGWECACGMVRVGENGKGQKKHKQKQKSSAPGPLSTPSLSLHLMHIQAFYDSMIVHDQIEHRQNNRAKTAGDHPAVNKFQNNLFHTPYLLRISAKQRLETYSR